MAPSWSKYVIVGSVGVGVTVAGLLARKSFAKTKEKRMTESKAKKKALKKKIKQQEKMLERKQKAQRERAAMIRDAALKRATAKAAVIKTKAVVEEVPPTKEVAATPASAPTSTEKKPAPAPTAAATDASVAAVAETATSDAPVADAVTADAAAVNITPAAKPTAATPEPASPAAPAATTEPVTTTPESAAATPESAAATPEPAVATPEPATDTLESAAAATPEPAAAATPEPAAAATPEPAAAATPESAVATEIATATPAAPAAETPVSLDTAEFKTVLKVYDTMLQGMEHVIVQLAQVRMQMQDKMDPMELEQTLLMQFKQAMEQIQFQSFQQAGIAPEEFAAVIGKYQKQPEIQSRIAKLEQLQRVVVGAPTPPAADVARIPESFGAQQIMELFKTMTDNTIKSLEEAIAEVKEEFGVACPKDKVESRFSEKKKANKEALYGKAGIDEQVLDAAMQQHMFNPELGTVLMEQTQRRETEMAKLRETYE